MEDVKEKPKVVYSVESKRGCGYRHPGKNGVGIYLTSPAGGENCERLPWPLTVCPCCGGGIRPARGWTWVRPSLLFPKNQEPICTCHGGAYHHSNLSHYRRCPVCNPDGVIGPDKDAGLIWIGEKFYPTPHDFLREGAEMGLSRKLSAIPNGFKLGETWVLLGYRKAIQEPNSPQMGDEITWVPGIFQVWRPTGLDLVINDPDDIPERALNIAKTHPEARLVKVIKDADVDDLFDDDDE